MQGTEAEERGEEAETQGGAARRGRGGDPDHCQEGQVNGQGKDENRSGSL